MRCRNLIHRILPWPMCTAVAKMTLFLAEVQSNRLPQLSQQFGPVDLVLKLQNPVQDMIWKKGRWNKNRLQYLKTNLLVFLTNSLEGGSKLLWTSTTPKRVKKLLLKSINGRNLHGYALTNSWEHKLTLPDYPFILRISFCNSPYFFP